MPHEIKKGGKHSIFFILIALAVIFKRIPYFYVRFIHITEFILNRLLNNFTDYISFSANKQTYNLHTIAHFFKIQSMW